MLPSGLFERIRNGSGLSGAAIFLPEVVASLDLIVSEIDRCFVELDLFVEFRLVNVSGMLWLICF